jgi:hypothetical protein
MDAKTITKKKIVCKPKQSPDNRYYNFIRSHYIEKETDLQITNTRIKGEHNGIQLGGGSFHISQEEYPTFLKLYAEKILANDEVENLTEKQLEEGKILMDIDLKYNFVSDFTGETEALRIPFGIDFFYPTD